MSRILLLYLTTKGVTGLICVFRTLQHNTFPHERKEIPMKKSLVFLPVLFFLVSPLLASAVTAEGTQIMVIDARAIDREHKSVPVGESPQTPIKRTLSTTQANAVVEVLSVGTDFYTVNFQTLSNNLSVGTTLTFNMTTPNGVNNELYRFIIPADGLNWTANLWHGGFGQVWPPGLTKFWVGITPPNGTMAQVGGYISYSTTCPTTGPLTRADVSSDGLSISLSGTLGGDTVATLNGSQVAVAGTMIHVPTDLNRGKYPVTVCSGGNCSTLVVVVGK